MNETRTKMVHIAFTEGEKEEIKQCAKNDNMTVSEFIRISIRDKMRRENNPNLFSSGNMNPELITNLLENQKKQIEYQKELMVKVETLSLINDSVEMLKSMVNRPELEEKENKVVDVLRVYGELKPNKIMEYSGYSSEMVSKIITNDKKFKYNINTGGFSLNE